VSAHATGFGQAGKLKAVKFVIQNWGPGTVKKQTARKYITSLPALS
jgi:hypothetical protein